MHRSSYLCVDKILRSQCSKKKKKSQRRKNINENNWLGARVIATISYQSVFVAILIHKRTSNRPQCPQLSSAS